VLYLLVCLRTSILHRLLSCVLLLAGFAVTIAPWTIRNSSLQETFVTIDTMGGRNLMMGNYEHTPLTRAWDAISMRGDKSWDAILAREQPDFRSLTQGQKDKRAMRRGLEFMASNPGLTAQRSLIKFLNFWQLERELVAAVGRGYFGTAPGGLVIVLTAVVFGSYAIALLLGIFGAILTPPPDWRVQLYLLLVIAFICGLHTLVFGHSRYHLPLIPLVLLYTASALTNLRTIWERRGTALFWLATLLSFVLIGSWIWETIFVDLERFTKLLGVAG
jgi:hypothetical protein